MISKRSLILGAGAAFITRPALALPSVCRSQFNRRRIGPVNPQCLAVPQGLVGYWPLGADTTDFHQGVTFDIGGNNNTGTLSNLTAASLAQGRVGTGLTFNGTSSSVSIGNQAALNFTGSCTLAAWAFLAASFSTGFQSIVGKWADTSPRQYILAFGSPAADNGIAFFINTSGNIAETLVSTAAQSTYVGAWHHFVGMNNAITTKTLIYIDGILNNTGTGTSLMATSTVAAEIGNHSSNDAFFNGQINDVRIYNRAIDPWEVSAIYQAGLAGSRTPYPQRKAI